jgi:ELWxxDGT repeat protein
MKKIFFAAAVSVSLLVANVRNGQGASGAALIADLNPGSAGSFPSNLTVFSKTLYFSAYTLETGRELWAYDGTNVSLVADINDTKHDIGFGTFEGNDSLPSWLTPFNGALYFSAYDPRRGAELWRHSDTTTDRVADISPDLDDTIKMNSNSSWPAELIEFSNALYFSANSGTTQTNYELWRYDGSSATLVTNIHPDLGTENSSYPNSLHIFEGALYFMANNGINGFELYKTDSSKTILLSDINPGGITSSSFPKQFTSYGGQLLFVANRDDVGYELWRSDGTNAILAADIYTGPGGSYPDYLTEYSGAVFFRAADALTGSELWKYDATNAMLMADINLGGDSFPKNLTVLDSHLIFTADDGIHGFELWKFDGTNAQLVADLNPNGDSFPENLTVLNHILYFTATTPGTGYELWQYDGTNVTLAADINPGTGDSYPQFLTVYDGKLLFRAAVDGVSDWELWTFTPFPVAPPESSVRFKDIQFQGTGVHLLWTTSGGSTNIVQASDNVTGPFINVGTQIIAPETGEVNADVLINNETTTSAYRFYRIKRL